MPEQIKVTMRKGRGGNWIAICTQDEHVAMGRTESACLSSMNAHFDSKHPGIFIRVDK